MKITETIRVSQYFRTFASRKSIASSVRYLFIYTYTLYIIMILSKQQLRRIIRERKQQYSAGQRATWSKDIVRLLLAHPRLQSAPIVMLYYSLPDEVDTRSLVDELVADGKTVLLPKVIDGEHMEARRYTSPADLAEGTLHLLEPVGAPFTDLASVPLIICPGMSFDNDGHRLGRGRGYYDRFLAGMPQAYKIGICFAFQRVDHVPVDASDILMDEVISNTTL